MRGSSRGACKRCGEIKVKTKDASLACGFSYRCKRCKALSAKGAYQRRKLRLNNPSTDRAVNKLKICKRCGKAQIKTPAPSVSKGYAYRCLDCDKIETKNYRAKNERRLRSRRKLYYLNNMERLKKYSKKFRKENPEYYRSAEAKYHTTAKYKKNAKVRAAASRAYKGGKQRCQICKERHAEMHHSDYTKPLDVMWLCKPHHHAWHRVFEAVL